MPEPLVTHFQELLAYEVWANDRAMAAIQSVPTDARTKPPSVRATQLLPHITLARTIWLLRIQGEPYENPTDWFPSWPLDETRRQLVTVDAQWRAFLASLTDPDLARTISYTSSEGIRYESSVRHICTHVFNHSTYHRGQIARLVHESGGQRPSTDFIAFTRTRA